jgi:hypothetical protein
MPEGVELLDKAIALSQPLTSCKLPPMLTSEAILRTRLMLLLAAAAGILALAIAIGYRHVRRMRLRRAT